MRGQGRGPWAPTLFVNPIYKPLHLFRQVQHGVAIWVYKGDMGTMACWAPPDFVSADLVSQSGALLLCHFHLDHIQLVWGENFQASYQL